MKPEDHIAKNFDLSFIAGEAIREEAARTAVDKLDNMFGSGASEPVVAGKGLEHLRDNVSKLVSGMMFNLTSTDMSQPYDSFNHDGVELVSRIVRLDSDASKCSGYFISSSIYLIGLMGENQTTATSQNCRFGAIKTSKGQVEFFKIQENNNLGKLVVHKEVQDADSERILIKEGHIDREELIITTLTPEERYMVVGEFEKATSSIDKQ